MADQMAFVKGSLILICANATAKILGAVFKIPLTYVLREEGMAIYQTAFSVYIMMLSLVPGGFGFATTKLLGECCALCEEKRASAIVRGMAVLLGVFGAFVAALMYMSADFLAIAMREPSAPDAIRVISVAVMVVAISSSVKSFNEADAHYIPTALSQVIEAAIKLLLGLFFAKLFKSCGKEPAVGALLAVVVGEAFQTIFLYVIWLFSRKNIPHTFITKQDTVKILSVAIPLTLTGLATGALAMTETAVIRNALSDIRFTQASAYEFLKCYSSYTDAFNSLPSRLFLTADGVRKLYGAFSGYAQTVFNLPVGIAATLTAAATPLFSRSITVGGVVDTEKTAVKVLMPVYFIIVPTSLVCTFFPRELLQLIFNNSFASGMLMVSAPAMLFLCASNMFIGILHLHSRIYEPFIAILLSLAVKIVATAILVRIPCINILGAGYAQVLSSLCLFVCVFCMTKRITGIKPDIVRCAAIPFLSGCVMIGAMKLTLFLLPFLKEGRLSFFISCLVGGGVYCGAHYVLTGKSLVHIKD